jgi:hypothetical protein
MRSRLNGPVGASSLVVLLSLLFTLQILNSHDWNPAAFFLLGNGNVDANDVPEGYDAQWHYQIALDPFGAAESLDWPALRYQRIVFPVLARMLGLGQPELIPFSMLLINVMAMGLGSFASAWLLVKRGQSAWWVLAVFISFPALLSVRFALLEPLAVALGLAGWAYAERTTTCAPRTLRQWVALLGIFALAGLTKEIGLLFGAALAICWLLSGQFRSAALLGAAAVLPYLIYSGWLTSIYGPAKEEMMQLLWVPFSGLVHLRDPASRGLVLYSVVIPAIAAGLMIVWDLAKYNFRSISREAIVLGVHIALIAVLPLATWQDPLAVIRTALGFMVSVILWLAVSRPRRLKVAAAWWVPALLILFIVPGLL